MAENEFVDYYELMQISPNAEAATIQRVFRMLAARYHPDNQQTGDMTLFLRLNDAYKTLIQPQSRIDYDILWTSHRQRPLGVFGRREFAVGIDGEANRRMGLLCLLYNCRRTDPESPGCSVLELERSMAFPREHLLFTLWYLKDKGLIQQNEKSDFVITSEGVDYVEERLPNNDVLYRLLKAADSGESRSTDESPWPEPPLGDDGRA